MKKNSVMRDLSVGTIMFLLIIICTLFFYFAASVKSFAALPTSSPSPASAVLPAPAVLPTQTPTTAASFVLPVLPTAQPQTVPSYSLPPLPAKTPVIVSGQDTLPLATATPDAALPGALSPAATFPSDAPTVDTGNNIGKNNFSKTSSKKNTVCDCILILGDSRACSLIKALWDSDDYESLYYYADRTNAIDAICQKGNRMIVICAEPGGSIASGAVERAAGRMLSLLNSNANLRNQKSYTFFNMFGLNDCILDKASASGYLSFDSNLIGNLPYCTHVYQLNAGPVCQNMNPVPDDAANAIIEKYNKGFKNTNDVTIVDLYTFLTTSGYHTEFSQIDVSGLHYDAATNVKIINYIMGIAGNVVSPVPNSSMGIPSALQITPAAAVTPSIAPTVSPVISTADSTASPAITPDSFKY